MGRATAAPPPSAPPFRVLVGQRIKELRYVRGWTQRRLAERLRLSASRLSKYESGARELPLETAVRLGQVFDLPVDALVGFEPGGAGSALDEWLHDRFKKVRTSGDERLKTAAIAVLDMVLAAHELFAAARSWERDEPA